MYAATHTRPKPLRPADGHPLTVSPITSSLRLDGGALPIKELKGDEPVESIDLSDKNLGSLSAIVIGNLISSNTVTKSLEYAHLRHSTY